MPQYIRGQRGSIMALTLLVVTLAAVIVGGFMQRASSGKLHASYEYQGMQAYYAAESGLNAVLADVALYTIALKDLADGDQAQLVGPTDVAQLDEVGNVVDVVGSYRVAVEKLSEPSMYLFTSYGTTPHAARIASTEAQVVFEPFFHEGVAAAIGSQTQVNLAISGSHKFAGTTGNEKMKIWYLFEDGDLWVHGSLDIKEHDEARTIDIYNGLFRTTDNEIDFAQDYPWLAGKQVQWDPPDELPNPLDEIRRLLQQSLIGSTYVEVELPGNQKKIDVRDGGQNKYRGNLDQCEIEGHGVLSLNDTKSSTDYIRIKELNLTGDMVLTANKPIWLMNVNPDSLALKPEGYRLVVINDGSVKVGSKGGGFDWEVGKFSSSEYSPFPLSNAYDSLTLGAGSLIWTAGNIVITGDLRPYRQGGDTVNQPDPDNPENRITSEEMKGWDSLALLARDGMIRFRMFKARGLLFSGGSILGYYLRLHGAAVVANPFRASGNETFGVANTHVTFDPTALDDYDLLKAMIGRMVRIH